ncbi:oxidoreductase [Actinoplanes sp. OR16]|uniref:WD40/YVTN/BNR-like repeat-containing protein n=1 Tax=Actinoplanes sp. OR16 TaxID=946334 RepID=UPI000F70A6B6|nr:oxidoreductase [Actinoplanes sp. OR16]BBH64107.1 oxidoreductase [Actinoplanes sp. OR16]
MTLQRKLSIPALALVMLTGSAWQLTTPASASGSTPAWRLTDTGSTARFRGLAPVDSRVAWAAGSAGTVLRTADGGRTWESVGPPEAAALQFRDIEAFDARTAVALTIGSGTDSRIYRTSDGGRSWTESFRNEDPVAFYDCLDFSDRRTGLALSDPVDGRFRILATRDGGRSWQVRPTVGMPEALPGEFAFAASGTCLVTQGRRAWFATGGASVSRVFASTDGGRTWSVSASPIPGGPSAGVYGLAFRGGQGLAVGGDYATPASAPDGAARSRDGGRHWTVARKVPGEYRSGVAWTNHSRTALAVGPTGSDISYDGGATWSRFDAGSFDAVACTRDGSCWASGEAGRIGRLARNR